MTDAKAKRVGRACALACKLAAEVESLYRLRSDLHVELQELVGGECAKRFDNAIMSSYWSTHEIGHLFSQLVATVEKDSATK